MRVCIAVWWVRGEKKVVMQHPPSPPPHPPNHLPSHTLPFFFSFFFFFFLTNLWSKLIKMMDKKEYRPSSVCDAIHSEHQFAGRLPRRFNNLTRVLTRAIAMLPLVLVRVPRK